MNIFRDKQVKGFGIFLIFFVFLFFLSGIGLADIQSKIGMNLFLSHNNAVVTSLLEQGVSDDVIAKAITNTAVSAKGTDFLSKIGVTEHTAIRFLPFVSEFQRFSGFSMLLLWGLMSIILLYGVYRFLWIREQLYLQAADVIDHFIEGDFSCHMPQMHEGTIYRLFALTEQLSMILQSKNESGHKTKEFLKNTISDISHQLKTPLAALTMYYEIISDEPDNLETVKEYSNKAGMSLKRMEQLIQSMLKITRLDAGSIIFIKNRCRISELVSLAASELTTRAASEGKEIIVDKSSEETIICDRQWTSEALGNIVKNALDHTGIGGRIRISWKRNPAMIRIFISDNGDGIAAEDLPHIFKRFYRSKKSLDTQGAGLGLSLAKSIVEGQDGMISVQSDQQEGTIFTVSFLTDM
ncbi:HAMP domain-containing sensor histidine kinase [Clostridium boliviensis]|uniref:histidine kinase n=1 Tax=Clostridium boliviensis TaxID=318465 RepID=A0ABU4GIJ3_9CLOT|nr:HAMP domain-containing sensor histidine kinase [Clostridium boliviensis]MDW2797416.1 HAMP domain-containing sensor histidine kinase [Clostridium boliviensis]